MKAPRTRLYFACLTACFCIVALFPALLDRPVYKTAFTDADWTSDGFFQWQPSPADLPSPLLSVSLLWRNFSPGTGISPGRLESAPFLLEKANLFVPVLGYPNSQYVGLYLESQVDKSRFWINAGAAHEQWQSVPITLPKTFVHTPVRLIAYSNLKEAYIGTGTPYYRVNPVFPGLAFSRMFVSVLFSVSYVGLLFFPAFYLLGRYTRRPAISSWLPAFLLTALAALALFYICHFSPSLARGLARLWLITALALGVFALRQHWGRVWRAGHSCLITAILLTVFQSCFLFSFATASVTYSANYLFYPASWSTDNQIPSDVAQVMANGSPLGEVAFGPWKISDRAPLLSCLLFPATTVLRQLPHQVDASTQRMILQMCSFGILNSWVLPVWVLLRRLRLREKRCIVALLLLAATPFIFFNTVYVWPKLLAATFCLVQHLLLSTGIRERARFSRQLLPVALSGIAAGLAVMAHGSAALAVLAIYAAALFRRPRGRWLYLALSGAAALLMVAPWLAWTKLAAPTINPLPRFLLTADFGFSQPRPSGVLESALHMYQTMPFSTWLQAKAAAAKTLLGLDLSIARMTLAPFRDPFQGFESIRAYQFFFLAPSLGLLLIPLLSFLWKRKNKQALPLPKRLIVRDLFLAATLTLVLHFTVMMAPHLLHHYPYFLPLSLHLLAVMAITTRDSNILRALAFANYLFFILFWIILILARTPVLSVGGIACALLLLAFATVIVGKWALGREPAAALR